MKTKRVATFETQMKQFQDNGFTVKFENESDPFYTYIYKGSEFVSKHNCFAVAYDRYFELVFNK